MSCNSQVDNIKNYNAHEKTNINRYHLFNKYLYSLYKLSFCRRLFMCYFYACCIHKYWYVKYFKSIYDIPLRVSNFSRNALILVF